MNEYSMTEKELRQYLLDRFPIENENCEWKPYHKIKDYFSAKEGEDVISYVSAISNMEGGHLIIGVEDSTLNIIGIDNYNYPAEKVRLRLTSQCANLPSEGLSIDEFRTTDTNKLIWVITIPKHSTRLPVYAHSKAWQRIDDSLVPLTTNRLNSIISEVELPYDWTAEIIPEATIKDLDEEAIQKALDGFCQRFPEKAKEARIWSVKKFLDKAKVTINGKITKAALLLLGREESVHYLNHPAEIVWKLQTGEERAASIFYPPFLLSAIKLRSCIRNYQIKIFPSNTLLPSEVIKYDQRSLLEALHNCILHQDYTKCERIVVSEDAESITFQNVGTFYEGSYEDYIEGDKTPTKYRNPFLQRAMLNLKMIDSQGFGIHDMFDRQRMRYLPMPDYEKSTNTHVVLEIPGQVINVEYSTALMENAELDLNVVFLLDRVQRNKPIGKEARSKLRKLNLIEGRFPHIIISSKIAQITHNEIEYTNLKGFDDDYYKDLIIKSLKEHRHLSRSQINLLILDKLPGILNDKQKKNHIDYLLKCLRKSGKIRVGQNKLWEIVKKTM